MNPSRRPLVFLDWAWRCLDKLRALDRITRMAEIADGDEPIAFPFQQDEICRPRVRLVRVVHQDGRPTFDLAGLQAPVVDRRIIAEIVVDLTAVHLRASDQLETDVL